MRPSKSRSNKPLQILLNHFIFREAAEAKAAAEQSQAAQSLPPEPAQNCGEPLANIR